MGTSQGADTLHMARPPSPYRKTLVEDCEVICVSTAMGNLALYGINFEYTRGGRGGQRRWFRCPRCRDACSSYIARSAHRSLPVVSATISHTSACKSMTHAWTGS